MNRWIVSIAIWGLYGAALILPATLIGADTNTLQADVIGYEALLHGWGWPGTIPALANVALLLGWILFLARKARFAAAAGVMAVALSLTAPAIYEVKFSELGAGYFLWLASCVALAVPAVLGALRRVEGIPPTGSAVTEP